MGVAGSVFKLYPCNFDFLQTTRFFASPNFAVYLLPFLKKYTQEKKKSFLVICRRYILVSLLPSDFLQTTQFFASPSFGVYLLPFLKKYTQEKKKFWLFVKDISLCPFYHQIFYKQPDFLTSSLHSGRFFLVVYKINKRGQVDLIFDRGKQKV